MLVSSLDATRSWHGTSVQLMQPLPVTGVQEVVNTTQLQSIQQGWIQDLEKGGAKGGMDAS